MRIRTKLVWLALLPLLVFLFLSGHALLVQRELELAHERSRQSDWLFTYTAELTISTYEYLTDGGERPLDVWLKKWQQISDVRERLRPHARHADEFYLLDEMQTLLTQAKRLRQEYAEIPPEAQRNRHREATGRKLLIDIKSLAPLAIHFNNLNHASIHALLQRQAMINLVLMFLLVIIVSPIAMTMIRSITASLAGLHAGIQQIFSGGKADHAPIVLSTADELTEVADHINRMSLRLHDTTVSRDELQQQVYERMAVEAKLAETMRFNEQIIEHSSVGILVYRYEGACVLANEAAGRIVGATTPTLLEQNFRKLSSWRDNGLFKAALESLVEHQPRQLEVFVKTSFGVETWINCHFTPLTLQGQYHLLMQFTDVSHLYRAQEVLRQAQATAEEANRAKSSFLATMSHEIRTPMNIVIGMSSVLLDTPLNDDQKHYVTLLNQAGNTLLQLINDILDLSKIEANKLEIHPEPMQLRKEVQEVTDLLRVLATGKGISLELRIDPQLPEWIVADGVRLRQCLYNLISNGVKFTEKGGILVELHPIEATPPRMACVITDTGIGIPLEHQEKIFESFTQSDSGITRRYGGTGLGLALSRRLVEMMGGEIRLESQPQQGSRFQVILPLQTTQATVQGFPRESSRQAVSLAPLKLLLVDDMEENRVLIKAFLDKTPCRLTTTCDGAQAVARIQQESFDLVLMDIEMPVMNGLEATARIRAWERERGGQPVPIIAFTAHSMTEDTLRSRAAGCTEHLSKPVQKDALLAVLARFSGQLHPEGSASPD
ncbi:MAG: response regulator [Magnetococcales bacterium]|nr:response regulator [Magnetococcales bacterium]